MKSSLLLIVCLITCSFYSKAQTTVAKNAQNDSLKSISESPAKSHLSYQSLSQFFQTTLTSGSNGGFNFTSSFFAIHYLFSKHNDSLSNYYLKESNGRNTQLSLGVSRASSTTDQISRITAGITWAPIHNRDKSLVNYSAQDGLLEDENSVAHALQFTRIIYTTRYIVNPILKKNLQSDQLKAAMQAAKELNDKKINEIKKMTGPGDNWERKDIEAILTPLKVDAATIKNVGDQVDQGKPDAGKNATAYRDTSHKAKVDDNFKAIGDSVFKSLYKLSYDSKFKELQKKYNDISKKIDMGSVLTFGFTPGYNVQKSHWDTTSFTVKYIVGIGSNIDKPWSLDVQFITVTQQDSSAKPKDFAHNKMKLLIGADKVFCRDSQDNPLLEAEFQGETDDVISGQYKHEKKYTTTANLVTSIHISKSFTLPVTLKYEPKGGNLFGFMSIQWNFQDNSKTSSSKK